MHSDPAPSASTAPPQPGRRRFAWLRAADDRLPTKWIATIGTGAFLAVTAAFGGLNSVAASGPAELAAGAEHVNEQMALTVTDARLVDTFPQTVVEPDERVLMLELVATNRWTEPLYTSQNESVSASVVVRGLHPDARALGVTRSDDGTAAPLLQPGVPAPLTLAWIVPDGAYAPGQTITVELRDLSLHTGAMIVAGTFWLDPVTAATMDLRIDAEAGL